MATSYTTRAKVYALGLPPEAFARPPRLIEAVVAGSGTFLLRAHGLAPNAPLQLGVFSESTLGAAPAALPGGAGLAEGVTYYAQPGASSDAFQVAASANGAVLSPFTDEGAGVFGILVDPGPDLDAAIGSASTLIDAHLVAHKAPVVADIVSDVCARLAARIYVGAHGLGNPVYAAAYAEIADMRIMDERLMAGWYSGRPLPAGSTDATPATAEMGAVAVNLKSRRFLEDEESRV